MSDFFEYKIPNYVFESKDLGRKEKLLFGYFYTHFLMNKEGCTATNVQLSYIIGTDKFKVSKVIKKLKDKELIRTEYKNRTPIESPKDVGVATLFKENKKSAFHNIERTIFVTEHHKRSRKRRKRNVS